MQIVTLLGRITLKHGRFPALVVVPNSTIMNWIREFEAWAPQIRAVPYFGEAASREIMKQYEVFHDKAISSFTKLKFHVLLTTYDTFNNRRHDKDWSSIFNGPSRWEVLVVDEGQRCKRCGYLSVSLSQGLLSEKRRLETFPRAQHSEGRAPYPDDWSK